MSAGSKPMSLLYCNSLSCNCISIASFSDFLHLIVDGRRAQLHSGFGSSRATIDLVAHLVEGPGIVAKLKTRHRLRELLLQLGLLRLIDKLHRFGRATLHLQHVIVARLERLLRCQLRMFNW